MDEISVLGESERETYGVYHLQSKLLNVKKSIKDKINKIRELQNIKTAIGWRLKHVMFMPDKDEDGAHIKGLLIHFFHRSWP